ncbi:Glucans biosynthesis glucosyltransferase H [Posidoniimonas polymericola]|uniref:Glucans biosynthesis glucosyltransferase H n=2 Tax=Posidoniimonas polymericola TaxID=2528002 RepID=A0A5C5ZFC8_9BACT|nr:Glucans biosynthesis glucosyltransferase H [Posidoniimonas polymericola]
MNQPEANAAPRRWAALLAVVAACSALVTLVFWNLVAGPSATFADVLVSFLFFVLTGWILLWTGVAVIGAFLLHRAHGETPQSFCQAGPSSGDRRCAVLLPTYNEDPSLIFAGLQAMVDSLVDTGNAARFDFYVLSDTTRPAVWLEEERQWRRLGAGQPGRPRVYYRHRNENSGKKAGNIADFCRRWGAKYEYMVVLDADSLVEGETLVEMARRMDADPKLGILQTPPLPLGGASTLSRCQQFVCRLCGPALTRGLAYVTADGGNYWGHNAIIRTGAFMRHCGLSALPGAPPLGGQILSHDFVEAALIHRAGYKVQLAWDLGGSYEQSPGTLPEFAVRDQRWSQGNLQHARLIVSRDIPWSNRMHFLTGVACYAASPVWLAFLLLSPLAFLDTGAAAVVGGGGIALFGSVMALLLLPRAIGLSLVARSRAEMEGFGGAARLIASTVFEFLVSVLIAPIMMAFHSTFVVSTLLGTCVGWNAQDRDTERLSWRDAFAVHWRHTAAGLATTAVAAWASPTLLLWLSPLLAGLVFSIPLSVALSSSWVGRAVRSVGLLQSPEETSPPDIVRRYHAHRTAGEQTPNAAAPTFRDFVQDGLGVSDHIVAISATRSVQVAPVQTVDRLTAWARGGAAVDPDEDDQRAVLCDPDALRGIHRDLWVHSRGRPLSTN